MARRLPLTELTPTPTRVDTVRRRLGGRSTSAAGAGRVVLVRTEGGGERAGVVLHVEGEVLHVWVAEGIVRKALNADVQAAAAPELETLANDARVFATLHEGERVRYQDSEGGLAEAMLAEKCRFGALLLRDDGKILGVGFRRIWPGPQARGPGGEAALPD
jgi:hypothetical protein